MVAAWLYICTFATLVVGVVRFVMEMRRTTHSMIDNQIAVGRYVRLELLYGRLGLLIAFRLFT